MSAFSPYKLELTIIGLVIAAIAAYLLYNEWLAGAQKRAANAPPVNNPILPGGMPVVTPLGSPGTGPGAVGGFLEYPSPAPFADVPVVGSVLDQFYAGGYNTMQSFREHCFRADGSYIWGCI